MPIDRNLISTSKAKEIAGEYLANDNTWSGDYEIHTFAKTESGTVSLKSQSGYMFVPATLWIGGEEQPTTIVVDAFEQEVVNTGDWDTMTDTYDVSPRERVLRAAEIAFESFKELTNGYPNEDSSLPTSPKSAGYNPRIYTQDTNDILVVYNPEHTDETAYTIVKNGETIQSGKGFGPIQKFNLLGHLKSIHENGIEQAEYYYPP